MKEEGVKLISQKKNPSKTPDLVGYKNILWSPYKDQRVRRLTYSECFLTSWRKGTHVTSSDTSHFVLLMQIPKLVNL